MWACTLAGDLEILPAGNEAYMKFRILTVLLTLAATLWLTNILQAQTPTPDSSSFTVNIPFSFEAGERTLPPGRYNVSHFPNSDWILFRSDDGQAISEIHVMPSSAPRGQSNSRLVFHRYGDIYFLARILTAPDNQVGECFKSSAERALERRQARNEVAILVNTH